jgi:aminopeptidase N
MNLNVLYWKLILFLQAGDRSLADVVAHEISHSWTGNLVTNQNFEHFWLNEGFTVFVERKILGKLHGEKARHLSAIGGLKDLRDAVSTVVPHFTLWLIGLGCYLCILDIFSSYSN